MLQRFGFVTNPTVLQKQLLCYSSAQAVRDTPHPLWAACPSAQSRSHGRSSSSRSGGTPRVPDSLCCLLSCFSAPPSRTWPILCHTPTNHTRIRSSPDLRGLTAFPSRSHLLLTHPDQRYAGLLSSLLGSHPWRDARGPTGTPARPGPARRPSTARPPHLAPLHPRCPAPAHPAGSAGSRCIPPLSLPFPGTPRAGRSRCPLAVA